MNNDDIGKYLAAMNRYQFLKLVKQHRPWLTRREAAALLGVSERCLEVWSAQGKGPTPVYKGKFVRYYIGVLDAWMMAKSQASSGTSGHSVASSKAAV